MKTMLTIILAAIISACALLMDTSEKAAQNAGKAIAEYCKLPEETRMQFREMVAKSAAPNSATISCVSNK